MIEKEVGMRKMVGLVMAVVLCWGLAASLGAQQQKAVNFKQLQEFLPKIDLPGYTKGKPTGQSSSAMGMSSSEASLKYVKDEETVEVNISDVTGVPMALAGLALMGATEFENQTENGYEKSVKIQGFPGTEKAETGESKSAEIQIIVGNRFIVRVSGSGMSDAALLRKLLDSMNLAGLAKLTAQ